MEPEQSKTQDPDVLLDVRHLTKSFVAACSIPRAVMGTNWSCHPCWSIWNLC